MKKLVYAYLLRSNYSRFDTLGTAVAVGVFAVDLTLRGFFYSLVVMILTTFVMEIAKLFEVENGR